MITLEEVESIHEILIDKFGGSKGIRDRGILESAINRPFQTFDQNELYPLPVDKAAAIFESIISNHPFVDGNKRTAYVLKRLILRENKLDIYADQNEKYEFVLRAAKGEMSRVRGDSQARFRENLRVKLLWVNRLAVMRWDEKPLTTWDRQE